MVTTSLRCWLLLQVLPWMMGTLAEPLLLTPLLKDADGHKTARVLSKVMIGNTSFGHSGYFTVPAQHRPDALDNNIFFWFQPCLSGCDPASAPLLVWLQGGPGAPGTFGAMTEIGNWYIDSALQPRERCFSWCKTRNCLFVDQPVETGFSFQTDRASGRPVTDMHRVDLTDTSPEAMAQVHGVLQQFFRVFTELKGAPVVITGESYGGLYTPNLGVILAADPAINFRALAVGDPCIHGAYQWLTYPDTLYAFGVVMQDERERLRAVVRSAVDNLKAWQEGRGSCRAAFDQWNSIWDDDGYVPQDAEAGPGRNVSLFTAMTGSTMTEDILEVSPPSSFDAHSKWFKLPEVASAFHITGYAAKQPTDPRLGQRTYDAFVESGDFCTNSSYQYAKLLATGDIDLMIYSSNVDALLGPPTTEGGVQAIMVDPHTPPALAKAYSSARKTLWTAGSGATAGYAKCASHARRFCYVVVRNAGHMTPAFQPRASLDMFERFMGDVAFEGDSKVPLPDCAQCGGAGPFAGASLPRCAQ